MKRKINFTRKMAMGGATRANLIDQLGSPVLDMITSLLDNSSEKQDQPLVNASTLKNMSPYRNFGMGGSVDDLDEEELAQLQAEADDLGISVEELLQQKQQDEPQDETDYSDNVDQTDNGQDESLAGQFDNEEEEQYAMGGNTKKKRIEVEGGEVMQQPNGQLHQIKGASHEEGGVNVTVPQGTKVYSDRLAVDGKTMQQRKKNREKMLSKLNNLTEDNSSVPLKNTIKRTSQIAALEEQADMALQEVANHLYGSPKKAAYGDGGDPEPELPWWVADQYRNQQQVQVPFQRGYKPPLTTVTGRTLPSTVISPKIPTTARTINPNLTTAPTPEPEPTMNAGRMTTGDYVGLAGNLFNAIAPIVNTRNAASDTLPNINRFRGFGRKALQENDNAQGYAERERTNALTDLATSTNAAYERNISGASSIQTKRALDIATNIGANKSRNSIDNTLSNQMIGLMDKRGNLENQKDQAEMQGQTVADEQNQQTIDNYYSNMAENLTNFGSNIQGIGKSLNVSKGNQDNIDLIGLLSQNGIKIGRNKKGGLILVNS